jgi:hypothetical protein
MSRNSYGRRGYGFDGEDIIGFIIGLIVLVGVTMGGVALANEDWCTGVEPDGDMEQIVCPDGWRDGETRGIREDEFEGEED